MFALCGCAETMFINFSASRAGCDSWFGLQQFLITMIQVHHETMFGQIKVWLFGQKVLIFSIWFTYILYKDGFMMHKEAKANSVSYVQSNLNI